MRSRGAWVVALISVLAPAAPASAQEPGELSPSPSVNQYVESVPTMKGSRPASAQGAQRRGQLPPSVRRRVRAQGGADAEALEAIATQPGLGAPPPREGGRRRSPGAGARGAAPSPPDRRSPIPAVVEATFDSGSGGAMTILLLGVLATTVAAGVAVARRRSHAS